MLFFQYLGPKNTKIHPKSFNYIKNDQLDPNWYFIKLKLTIYLKNRPTLFGLHRGRAGQQLTHEWGMERRGARAERLLRRVGGAWCALEHALAGVWSARRERVLR